MTTALNRKRIFGWVKRALLHHLRGAQIAAPMDDGDRIGEPGEEERLFHCGVTPTDHCDVLPAEEETVAGRAGGDAVAEETLFVRKIEHQRLGPGRDDDRLRRVGRLGGRGIPEPDAERSSREVDPGRLGGDELGAESRGLFAEYLHELGAHDPLDEPGVVLDLGGEHELAPRLVTRRGGLALDHERRELGASRVDRRGEPGRARTDDHHLARLGHDARPALVARSVRCHQSRRPTMTKRAPTTRSDSQTRPSKA